MSLFLVSKNSNEDLIDILKRFGQVVFLDENPCLNKAESCHPDMQVFKTGNDSCIVAPGISIKVIEKLQSYGISVLTGIDKLSVFYPDNIKYNVLKTDRHIIHNLKHTASDVLNYAEENSLDLINVKQGYCACTSCFVEFCNLIITGDPGIIKAAKDHNYNVCVFEHNNEIILEGYDHGFIGGCIVSLNKGKTLIFNGDIIRLYPDFVKRLESFGIEVFGVKNASLNDIGGVICFLEQI